MKMHLRGVTCVCLALVSSVQAEQISWKIELGRSVNPDPNAIQEGALVLTFDSENIRFTLNRPEWQFRQWWVTDFVLTLDGVSYIPGPPRNPPYPGVIGQEQNISDEAWSPVQRVGLDFDLENGKQFAWSLTSNVGNGNTLIFPDGDVFSVATPLGTLPRADFSGNLIQGGLPDGRGFNLQVVKWQTFNPISIDIKPGSETNPINLGANGVIPVAILTTEDFDATNVNPDSVQFARASPLRSAIDDVDGDTDWDVIFHFATQGTNIACGDTEVTLTGDTFDGTPITGTDVIKTLSCSQ